MVIKLEEITADNLEDVLKLKVLKIKRTLFQLQLILYRKRTFTKKMPIRVNGTLPTDVNVTFIANKVAEGVL